MTRWLGACLAACLIGAAAAEAQIVRIGPFGGVRVRAPFTSVDVLPYGGGTRVRAPFTAVDTGAFQYGAALRYYPGGAYYAGRAGALHYAAPLYPVDPILAMPIYPVPIYPVPVYPTPLYPELVYPEQPIVEPLHEHPPIQQLEQPLVGLLDDRLRAAALQLQQSLSLRRDDGDVWQNYLAPHAIVGVIDQAGDPQSLRELLRNYNGVVANPSLTSIRYANGFEETRRLLREFIERAAARELPPPLDEPSPPPAPVPL
jgi:hypothetical protein